MTQRSTVPTPYGSVDIDPERWTATEQAMIAAGTCPWQTGYGLPHTTYCGEPGMPFCPAHEADEKEAQAQTPGTTLAYSNVVTS